MPAASAEKRARQRANKASRQETMPTKLQRPQSTSSKAPECPTSPVTPHPPVSDDIMHPASIERLIGLAKDSPPNSPLGIVWRHAFEEGKGIGYSEGTRLVNGLEVNEITRIGVERGIERGIEIGRDRERRIWDAAGHSNTCITVARPPRGIAVQTEDPLPRFIATAAVQVETLKQLPATPNLPPTLDIGVQSETPHAPPLVSLSTTKTSAPSLTNVDIQTSDTEVSSFDWAEDATPLPVLPLPPRNLSGLRSSKSNPFSSLQHRSKHFTHYSSQSRRRHSHFNSNSFYSPRHSSFNPTYFHTKTHSHLNWESDPRLLDLSRCLKALGWIRAN